MRRIALGNHCSLQITIDPLRPKAVPETRFLGSDTVIVPLREKFNKNLHQWSNSAGLRANLENVLGVTFPSPKTSKKEDFSMECAVSSLIFHLRLPNKICYAYRLENAIPDRVCDNLKCGKAFHRLCLFEWLRAIPSSRQSFDTIFGTCPYCSNPITVKMTSTT
jgi:E3 ubiquitin-protein ligase FANCL